jgi:energy-converting hydrogenase Eha subunit H
MSSIEYSKDASTVGMVDFGVETFYARLVGPFVRVGSKDALLVNILSHLLIDLSRTILLGSGIGSGLAIHI